MTPVARRVCENERENILWESTPVTSASTRREHLRRAGYKHQLDSGKSDLSRQSTGNLDFDARVPIPFSIFPSTYRNVAAAAPNKVEETHVEGEIKLPALQQSSAGRDGQQSSYSASLPPQEQDQRTEEKVHINVKEDHHHHHRPSLFRRPTQEHSTTHIDVELPPRHLEQSQQYQQPQFQQSQIQQPQIQQSQFQQPLNQYHSDNNLNSTIDIAERQYRTRYQPNFQERVSIESNVQPSKVILNDKMGYYDEAGHYHSFRNGLHRVADRIVHGSHHHSNPEIDVEITSTTSGGSSQAPRYQGSQGAGVPNTITIPTNHVRIGDIVILQGRASQVIKITTSPATGQHRFLGVDLFTKQLHEDSSFISSPSPSVVVQTVLGPVLKQYRVLDLNDGTVVAMTETGDVKQSLPVIDQSNLWARLNEAFESGRGSVRVLVLNDQGRELAVDMKVIHGSRL
ncbi:hypothetical protein VE03_06063 [Pseudogymnoascus sp. 23342-1-I1]|nr:hypothetical protein VE03_06063 [Pseudogymnoascus sp. 23342-1-I1]